jgi:hypothetical protein
MGKGSRNKKPKHKKRPHAGQQRQDTPKAVGAPEEPTFALRPPPERQQHGKVILPFGVGKNERPATVEGVDMVAKLYEGGQLTYTQEQAARSFQQLHADYVADLGVSTGRSCLDIGPVGHDAGDGNPEVAARHRRIVRALGMIREAEVRRVVLSGQRPRNLLVLKDGLNVVANAC